MRLLDTFLQQVIGWLPGCLAQMLENNPAQRNSSCREALVSGWPISAAVAAAAVFAAAQRTDKRRWIWMLPVLPKQEQQRRCVILLGIQLSPKE